MNDLKEKEIYFDYKFLKLDIKTNQTLPSISFWIYATLFIFILIELIFLSRTFSGIVYSVLSNIKKEYIYDLIYLAGFIGTILISFDIYSIDRLKKIEIKIYDLIKNYYIGFKSALKVSILISDRSKMDINTWYSGASLIILLIYYMHYNDNIYIEDLSYNSNFLKYFLAFLWALIIVKIFIILDDLSQLFRDFGNSLVLYLIFYFNKAIVVILNTNTISIANYEIYPKAFAFFFIYLYIAYLLSSGIYLFEKYSTKIIIWFLILIGAFPFLILKLISRIIPFIIFYPAYIIVKLSLILKANSLIRHIGLALFIIAEIAKKIIEYCQK